MGYDWETCPSNIRDFVQELQISISEILKDDVTGFYLHGSLAMGGFNPNSSDIDISVVTNNRIRLEQKRNLARVFLNYSGSPYPIEISFLNRNQLMNWEHPCLYDFHYSEYWRTRYEEELVNNTNKYINDDIHSDEDLAAHITIINHRGICLMGRPINEVFPDIPKSDYISSIINDYQDCLTNIEDDPIYCSLNILRVYWYLKEGVISSKVEAGNWGMKNLPENIAETVRKVNDSYQSENNSISFKKEELISLRNYISTRVEKLMT